MKEHLAIIFDSSGSLKEYQREYLLNYLLSMIVDSLIFFKVKDVDYSFYIWNEQIEEISHDHQFDPKGKASLKKLSQKIKELSNDKATAFLVLSDDVFSDIQNIDEYYIQPLKDINVPIAWSLIGAGDKEILRPLTKFVEPISADSLGAFLKVFPTLYKI